MLHHSRTITVIGKNWLRPVFFGVENKYKNEVWFFLPFRGQVDTKREKVLTNKELAVSTCGVNLCQFGFYGHKIDDVEIFYRKADTIDSQQLTRPWCQTVSRFDF